MKEEVVIEVIKRGKTKKVWRSSDKKRERYVIIEAMDNIMAGTRRDVIKGKGKYCNAITCNVFDLLNKNEIHNHFLAKDGDNCFLANNLKMISLEVIIWRIAIGSCPKRLGIEPETVFDKPLVEFRFKCDSLRNPIIEWNNDRNEFILYDAYEPRREGFLGMLKQVLIYNDLEISDFVLPKLEEVGLITYIARNTFTCIEKAWGKLNIVIPNMKIKLGYDFNGNITVGDTIDNDSWRARSFRDNGMLWEEMSRQAYRDLPKVTAEGLEMVRQKYEKMAELSNELI